MISTDRSGAEVGVRTTEQVKLSVEHADVAVMCLGLDATIEGEQGDARNEYASGDKLGLICRDFRKNFWKLLQRWENRWWFC